MFPLDAGRVHDVIHMPVGEQQRFYPVPLGGQPIRRLLGRIHQEAGPGRKKQFVSNRPPVKLSMTMRPSIGRIDQMQIPEIFASRPPPDGI